MSKVNIKIMSKAPEVSDEEIRKLMNFSGLIENQKTTVAQQTRINKNIRTAVIATSIVGIAALVYFNWPAQTPDPSTKSETIASDSVSNETITSSPLRDEHVKKESSVILPRQKEQKEKQTTSVDIGKTDSTAKVVRQTVQYTEAEPVEGFPHLYDYFNRGLTYPIAALKDSIQGIVTVSFIVNKEGKAENFQIANSLGEAFDQEALRVMKDMPAWKPAMVNNRPIASKISIPLTFNFHTSKQK